MDRYDARPPLRHEDDGGEAMTELEKLQERVEVLRSGVDAAKTEAHRANSIGAHMFLMGLQTALNIMDDSGITPPVDPRDSLPWQLPADVNQTDPDAQR